jgi:hypothetical protein
VLIPLFFDVSHLIEFIQYVYLRILSSNFFILPFLSPSQESPSILTTCTGSLDFFIFDKLFQRYLNQDIHDYSSQAYNFLPFTVVIIPPSRGHFVSSPQNDFLLQFSPFHNVLPILVHYSFSSFFVCSIFVLPPTALI